ncbi:MAG: hypothetical protein VYB09_04045 [Planctomycetota bacterium]|nr:hypothetical protein [Planctomycetota bacterium]
MANYPPSPPPAAWPQQPPPPPPPPRTSRKWIWILILIPASIVGVVMLFLSAGLLFVATGKEEPVTEADRAVLVDIDHLSEWMFDEYVPEKRGETVTKTRYIDGSYDIEYEYDIPEDLNAPYLSCIITVERKISDARTSYVAMWSGSQLGMSLQSDVEIDVVERNDLFRWGDRSRFAILFTEGEPFGNVFITRTGKHIFYIVISGVYFDHQEGIRGMLSEHLDRLKSYQP